MSTEQLAKPVTRDAATVDELRGCLQRDNLRLFAVLDACDEPRVPVFVRQQQERAVSLYRGHAERDYWDIAPYLVSVDDDGLTWIYDHLWGEPFGIFAVSRASLADVRKHFRRFLLVDGPDGKELYFRFYDPRVLPLFLDVVHVELAARFFGPIESFFVVTEDQEVQRLRPAARSTSEARSVRRLVFTDADLKLLAGGRRAGFRDRLIAHLAQQLSARARPFDQRELARQVDEGLRRTQRYELKTQQDIARYMEAMCVKLGGFTHRADAIAAQNVLFDRRVSTSERLDRLHDWADSQVASHSG